MEYFGLVVRIRGADKYIVPALIELVGDDVERPPIPAGAATTP